MFFFVQIKTARRVRNGTNPSAIGIKGFSVGLYKFVVMD